jgi:predicted alternative tryptophan synthase beta-subunit
MISNSNIYLKDENNIDTHRHDTNSSIAHKFILQKQTSSRGSETKSHGQGRHGAIW